MTWIGRSFGVYKVTSLLGSGGMGEVYRALDTRLAREVAIKVLPGRVDGPDRLARFNREARALAALNHPNIATIHGVETYDGAPAIVMELVEGETLAERIALHPARRIGRLRAIGHAETARARGLQAGLPVEDALAIARQIADALNAAHERGIVHRDLKPANVMITRDGVAKVLDFGLAYTEKSPGRVDGARDPDEPPPPTLTVNATNPGLLMGTAAYMSPEQARGQRADKRADIWAFACILYEMLAGRAVFARDTGSDTLAAVLERDPDWSALPSDLAPPIRRLLRRCLEKDPRRRLHDIADARLELDETDDTPPALADRRSAHRWLRWAIVTPTVIAAATAAALLAARFMTPGPPATDWGRNVVSFAIEPDDGTTISNAFVLSHDGRQLAWVGSGADGVSRLWIRPLDSPAARALPGTEDASWPFWAPDGREIGFIQGQTVKRVAVDGGPVRTVGNTSEAALGAAWSSTGVIVFSARLALFEVPESGGPTTQIATIDRSRQEDSLRFPRFLPDGRRYLYVARTGRRENSSVYIASLDGGAPRRLFSVMSNVQYASEHLLYVHEGTLVARPFDADTLALGDPVTVATNVFGGNRPGLDASFTASANGVLAYRGGSAPLSVLRWFDRQGQPQATLGAARGYTRIRIAPDGHRVATAFPDERTGVRSVWILDSDGAAPFRLTFGGVDEWMPMWGPDDRVGFVSTRNGTFDIYAKQSAGSGSDEPLIVDDEITAGDDWSQHGLVAFFRNRETTRRDLFVAPIEKGAGARDEIAIAVTEADEGDARFSPDGRWIAYASNETGRPEVYVQPFPPTGGKWQISLEGATEPTWARGGRELLYLGLDGMLNAVDVLGDAESFRTGAVLPLFRAGPPATPGGSRYDVTADGERFLVQVPLPLPPEPLMVLVNWLEALDQRN